jgi:hypothetical protein
MGIRGEREGVLKGYCRDGRSTPTPADL